MKRFILTFLLIGLGILVVLPAAAVAQDRAQTAKDAFIARLKALPDETRAQIKGEVERLGEEDTRTVVGIGIRYDGTKDKAVVTEVMSGKPAAEAGVRSGDRIVAINGKAVFSGEQVFEEFKGLRASWKPGDAVTLALNRDGAGLTVRMTTAVLREDRTAEMKKLREAIEKESAVYVAKIKSAADTAVKAFESGSQDTKSIVAPVMSAHAEYDTWLDQKLEEAAALLEVK